MDAFFYPCFLNSDSSIDRVSRNSLQGGCKTDSSWLENGLFFHLQNYCRPIVFGLKTMHSHSKNSRWIFRVKLRCSVGTFPNDFLYTRTRLTYSVLGSSHNSLGKISPFPMRTKYIRLCLFLQAIYMPENFFVRPFKKIHTLWWQLSNVFTAFSPVAIAYTNIRTTIIYFLYSTFWPSNRTFFRLQSVISFSRQCDSAPTNTLASTSLVSTTYGPTFLALGSY